MPAPPERIPVTNDAELAVALDSVAAIVPGGTDAATLVRDLAIRGAEPMLAEHRADPAAIERLIEHTTGDDPPFDRAVLAGIDRVAWGIEE
jgi:enhancing lycopene biosynthesis protein 2